jgi:hypothetical protein
MLMLMRHEQGDFTSTLMSARVRPTLMSVPLHRDQNLKLTLMSVPLHRDQVDLYGVQGLESTFTVA